MIDFIQREPILPADWEYEPVIDCLYPKEARIIYWALSTVLKTELEHLKEAEHYFRNGYEISKRREFVEEELKKVTNMVKDGYELNSSLLISSPF